MRDSSVCLNWEYAFGPAKAKFPKLELPGTAMASVQWLAESQSELLDVLVTLDDDELDVPRRTNWGQKWPTRQLFKTLLDEQIHHGAEVALLRDLYRNRATVGRRDDTTATIGRALTVEGASRRASRKPTRSSTKSTR